MERIKGYSNECRVKVFLLFSFFTSITCLANPNPQLDQFMNAQISKMNQDKESVSEKIKADVERHRLINSKRIEIDLKIQELRALNSSDPNEIKRIKNEMSKLESQKKQLPN